MNAWIVLAGAAGGLGCFLLVREIFPAPVRLDAALARLAPGGIRQNAVVTPQYRARVGRWMAEAAPWLPVPTADLRLLGQDTEAWLASKIAVGLLGLVVPACLTGLLALTGTRAGWTAPAAAALAFGVAGFFAPDLVTRVNARERRADFRHALTTYVDLVALQRSAGAGPTQALEAAAGIGGGWAFERIENALTQARRAGVEPWAGLARLGAETGLPEVADLADIAATAGQEGARVLDTLMSRAAAMRSAALADTRAKAASRTTTMVIPVALLATAFVILLIFPDFYRLFVSG